MTDLRYPIGKYEAQPFSEKQKEEWLNDIKISSAVVGKCNFKSGCSTIGNALP